MDSFIQKVLGTNPAFSKVVANATNCTRVVGTVPTTIKDSNRYRTVKHTYSSIR